MRETPRGASASLSKTPPKIIEQIASETSIGIPTSHGSQYFVHPLLPDHVPRMNEEARSEILRRLEKGEKLRRIPVPLVDVRADFDALEIRSSFTQRSSSRMASFGS